jgi:DNA-binding ferritin-like protein (Dps family)
MFQQVPLPLTEEALNEYGKLFTGYLKKEIQKRQFPYGNPERGLGDKVASGKLLNSIDYEVITGSDGNPTLEISYIDYFENVNLGRRREKKKVPINALLNWIKVRGLKGRNKKGQFIPNLSFAFAIQTNIFKFGIRETNIYDKGLDGLLDFVDNPPPELQGELQEIYRMIGEDVNNFIEKTITKELVSKT